MKIHFRPEGGTGCEYYRAEIPARALRLRGHDVTVARGFKVLVNEKTGAMQKPLTDADVVVWQRPLTSEDARTIALPARYLKVVDIDDDLFHIPPWNPFYIASKKRNDFRYVDYLADCLKAADLVTVTTPELAMVVRQYNDRVTVLPNFIDFDEWTAARALAGEPAEGPVRVGWSGWTHTGDLDVLRGAIEPVLRRHDARLVLIGWSEAPALFDYPSEFIDWTPIDEYKRHVATLDIGLVPLADNPFNSCKSRIKALEYMAAGAVPIASKHHGDYARLISPDHDGYLALRPQKWIRRLDHLLEDEATRERVRANALETARANGLEAAGEAYERAFSEALESDSVRRRVFAIPAGVPSFVSIVIPVLDELPLLRRCISAIRRTVDRKDYELIIVDNASAKPTADYCQKNADVYIQNAENEGFAAAANAGILNSQGDVVIILNSDTIPAKGWTAAIRKAFATSGAVGVVVPVTNYSRGEQCDRSIHDDKTFGAMANGTFVNVTTAEVEATAKRVTAGKRAQVDDADNLSGFCIALAPALIDAIGGFDTTYSLGGGEDLDYYDRARRAGFRTVIARGAVVWHFGHRTMRNVYSDYRVTMLETEKDFKSRKRDDDDAGYVPLVKETYRVPVLFLTWNRLEYTKVALDALRDRTKGYQLFIVDDASDDGTREWLAGLDRADYRIASVILNRQRRGVDQNQERFCKQVRGCPLAAKVDNDTVVPAGWLPALVSAMNDARLDVVGPDHYLGVGMAGDDEVRRVYFDRKNRVPVTGGGVYLFRHVGGSGVVWRQAFVEEMFRRGLTLAKRDEVTLDEWTYFQWTAGAVLGARAGFFDGVFVDLLDMDHDNARRGDYPEYERLMLDERRKALAKS